MLTDSRSFLSYPRHEYFRRILCDLLGAEVASGRLPDRREWLTGLVADVCYRNAKNYFGFPSQETAPGPLNVTQKSRAQITQR